MASDNFDLYADLDEALIEPLQEEVAKKEAENLVKLEDEKKFKEETLKQIELLERSNTQLKKNMSILLSTAKAEIERKDQQIKDLRREMDQIIFRKTKINKSTSEKGIQTYPNEIRRSDNKNNSKRRSEDRNIERDSRKRRNSPENNYSSRYDKNKRSSNRSRSRSHHREYDQKSSSSLDKRNKEESNKKRVRDSHRKEDDLRETILKKKCFEKTNEKNIEKKSKELTATKKFDSHSLYSKKENEEQQVSKQKKSLTNCENKDSLKLEDKIGETTVDHQQLPIKKDDKIKEEAVLNNETFVEPKMIDDSDQTKEMVEPIPITNADSQPYLIDMDLCEVDSNIEQQEVQQKSSETKDNVLSPVGLLNLETKNVSENVELKTTENISGPSENRKDDQQDETESKSTNESFESIKENSLNNSLENEKHKKKRKIITTEVEDDGTVVFTVVRKKKKRNSNK